MDDKVRDYGLTDLLDLARDDIALALTIAFERGQATTMTDDEIMRRAMALAGSRTSERKTAAARINSRRAGRPKGSTRKPQPPTE